MKPTLKDSNVRHPADGWETEAALRKRQMAWRLREAWQDRESGYNEEWAAFVAQTSRSRRGSAPANAEWPPRVWNLPVGR